MKLELMPLPVKYLKGHGASCDAPGLPFARTMNFVSMLLTLTSAIFAVVRYVSVCLPVRLYGRHTPELCLKLDLL